MQTLFWDVCGDSLSRVGFDRVEVVIADPREVLERDIRLGHLHLSIVHSSVVTDFLSANEDLSRLGYEPIAYYGGYRSVVVVNSRSAISSLSDLQGTPVACVDEHSLSGCNYSAIKNAATMRVCG